MEFELGLKGPFWVEISSNDRIREIGSVSAIVRETS